MAYFDAYYRLKDLMKEIVTQVLHAPDSSRKERYTLLNDTVASIHQLSNATSSNDWWLLKITTLSSDPHDTYITT